MNDFFLKPPDEKDLQKVSLDEVFEILMKMVEMKDKPSTIDETTIGIEIIEKPKTTN